MRWQIAFKILLIILLILLAAPLLGALAMMPTGGRLMPQVPRKVHGGKAAQGLAFVRGTLLPLPGHIL